MSNWADEAKCKNLGFHIFYADNEDKESNNLKEIYAKNICRQCPVAAECLMYAFDNEEAFGIWGSFAPKERGTLLSLFSKKKIDISLCRSVVNKHIRSIKAELLKSEFKKI